MMSFSTAIKICFKKYFTVSGRATRAEYWWFRLFTWLVMAVWILPLTIAISNDNETMAGIISFPLSITLLAIAIPNICVLIRRLHDIGTSGTALFLMILGGIGSIILTIMCLCKSADDNEYGPNPFKLTDETTSSMEANEVVSSEDIFL